MSRVLTIEGLNYAYSAKRGVRRVLFDNVLWSCSDHGIVGVLGKSGSGKSTLGRIISGRLIADAGTMQLDDLSIDLASSRARASSKIQYVSQNVAQSFHPLWAVGRGLKEIVRFSRFTRRGSEDGRDCILGYLASLQLESDVLCRVPGKLSGGQLQRLANVRALLVRPKVLVLDEPTSALDVLSRRRLIQLLSALREKRGLKLVLISHDTEFLAASCDAVYRLENGKLQEEKAPA